MFRLTRTAQTPTTAVLTIDGLLSADQVPLLADEIGRCRQQCTRLILQLDGVGQIDPEGIALLQQWCGADGDPKVVLQGGSPFLRALLHRAGLQTL